LQGCRLQQEKCLKILSSEMGLAKSELIPKVLIKGIIVGISENFARPPSFKEPFKVLERPLVFL
jgi:hypothetical protein